MTSFPPYKHHPPLPQRPSLLGKRNTFDHPHRNNTNTGENAHDHHRTHELLRAAPSSLWTSLHRILRADDAPTNPRETARREDDDDDDDVYRRFAGRTPLRDADSKEDAISDSSRRRRLEEWTERALDEAGVIGGGGGGGVSFSRREEEEEERCDVRFSVWFVKEMLLCGGSDGQGEDVSNARGDEDAVRLFRSYESAVEALIADVDDANEESRPLWRALLRKARLDPAEWTRRFRRHFETDGGDSDDRSVVFRLPSSLRKAVRPTETSPTKRRKLDDAHHWTRGGAAAPIEDAAWWPLLGYLATRAFFSLSPVGARPPRQSIFASMHRKMNRVRSNFMKTLPAMMGIPFFHVKKKQALSSGVAACVLDALAETVVIGARHWSEEENDEDDDEPNRLALAMDSETYRQEYTASCFIFGAEAGQVVDILLTPGVLPTLAKTIDATVPGLVADSADLLLSYSQIHRRLRRPHSDVHPPTTAEDDGKDIVRFIRRGHPELTSELMRRTFTATALSSDDIHDDDYLDDGLGPLHPVEVDVRANLLAGNLADVARTCRTLESCTGISIGTKERCWMRLLDKMHEEGRLLDDFSRSGRRDDVAWSDRRNRNLALSHLQTGTIGRTVVLNYLRDVVAMAEQDLLPNPPSSFRAHDDESTHRELLCVKDAVRRAVLKFLLPRNFSAREALTIADDVSDAGRVPKLEVRNVGTRVRTTAAEVANAILASKPLYLAWNEQVGWEESDDDDDEEEEEVVIMQREGGRRHEESEYSPVEEGINEANGAVDMSVEEPNTPLREDNILGQKSEDDEQDVAPGAREGVGIEGEDGDVVDDRVETTEADTVDEVPIDKSTYNNKKVEKEAGCDSQDDNDKDHSEVEDENNFEECQDESSSEESSHVESSESELDKSDNDLDDGEERDDVRHHHHCVGNYSASDDYDDEDTAEADRHVAFQGDSENESDESDEVVEILDSSDEGDEEADEEVEMDESSNEDEEERVETLNEAVDKYIAAQVARESTEVASEGDFAKSERIAAQESTEVASEADSAESEPRNKKSGLVEDSVDANYEEEDFGIDDDEGKEIPDGDERKDSEKGHEKVGHEASAPIPDKTAIPVASVMKDPADHREGVVAGETTSSKTHIPSESAPDLPSEVQHSSADPVDVSEERRPEALRDIESSKSGSTPQKPTESSNSLVDIPARSSVDQGDAQHNHLEQNTPESKNSFVNEEHCAEDFVPEKVGDAPMEVDSQNLIHIQTEPDVKADKDFDVNTSMKAEEQKYSPSETNARDADHDAAAYSSDAGNPARSLSDTDDMNMADDEHESIDTEEDKRSLAEGSQQGETFDEDEVEPSKSPETSPTAHTANDVDKHDDKPSVLVAAAMSSQRQGSNFLQSSTPNRPFELEEDMESDEESSSEEKVSEDDGYVPDAEATEEEHLESRKDEKKRSAVDDDGYIPDAEATEEDKSKGTKKDEPSGAGIEDGYMPDGGHTTGGEEASEVEQGDDSNKRITRDVRFESVLETSIDGLATVEVPMIEATLAEAATCQSIDEGYLPSDGLTEEEKMERRNLSKNRATKPTSTQSVDEGYVPDGGLTEEERGEREKRRRRATDSGYLPDGGHTTPGDATEEDQADEVVKRGSPKVQQIATTEAIIEKQKVSASIHVEKRFEDVIDEGYLPSAVEGTEEERSEEEDTTVHANPNNRTTASARDSKAQPQEAGEGEAVASVLVTAALFSQQKGAEDASSPVDDVVIADTSLSASSFDEKSGIPSFDDTSTAIPPPDSKLPGDHETQDPSNAADAATGDISRFEAGSSVKSQENSQGEVVTKVETSGATEKGKTVDDEKANSRESPAVEITGTTEKCTKDDEDIDHKMDYTSATEGNIPAKENFDETTEQQLGNDKPDTGTLLAEQSELAPKRAEVPSADDGIEKKTIETVHEDMITLPKHVTATTHSVGIITGLNEQKELELETGKAASIQLDKNMSQSPKEEIHASLEVQEDNSVEKSLISGLRRSTRRKSTGSQSSSHDVPTSIVTRNKRRRRTGLPPVPEEGTIVNPTIVESFRNEQDAMDTVDKMDDDDNDSSIASSVGSKDDDSVSIAHQKTSEQPGNTADNGGFILDESTPVKSKGEKSTGSPSIDRIEGSDDASVASTRSRRSTRLKAKEKSPAVKDENEDAFETPRRTRRSLAKDGVNDPENWSVTSKRSGRSKQSQGKGYSPETKRQSLRRTPARKSIAKDDEDADTASVSPSKGKRKAASNEQGSVTRSATKKTRKGAKTTEPGGDEKNSTPGSISVTSLRGGKGRSSKKSSKEKSQEMNVPDDADDGSRSRTSTRPNTRAKSLTKAGAEQSATSPATSTGVRRSARNAKKKDHDIASDYENKGDDSISMASTETRRLTRSAKKTRRSEGSTHNLRSSDMETRSHQHYQHE